MRYCVSQRKMTETVNIKPKLTKNNKPYIIGECTECGKKSLNLLRKMRLREWIFK